MYENQPVSIGRTSESALATNKVLRNTYALLAMTLVFSALTAGAAMFMGVSFGAGTIATLAGIALLWLVLPRTANSAAGIGVVFLITGLLGFGVGPLVSHYMSFGNGGNIVMTALGGTGAIFLGLSAYVLTTRKDFSFLGGMIITGLIAMVVLMLVGLFVNMPALHLAISAGIIMLMSAYILWETSAIIHGGQTNYIMATASLYLSILNIFTSLLRLLGALGGDD